MDKTSFDVQILEGDYLHLTVQTKETYFSSHVKVGKKLIFNLHDFKLQARLRFFTAKLLFVLVLLQNDLDEIKIIATKIPPLLSLPCALLLDVLVT